MIPVANALALLWAALVAVIGVAVLQVICK